MKLTYILECRTRYQNYPRIRGEPSVKVTDWEPVFSSESMADVDAFAKEYLQESSPDGTYRVDSELGVYTSGPVGAYPQEQCRITVVKTDEPAWKQLAFL